ncbi:SpoIID/LytB domain protein [Halothece sp. PCC 7418]|uniref:SpoIID/LytB domain-containing protein n=1 Tax=Halothece sp. (strain PCC 7418) TaxID=65093 RepID=UPI0002A05BE9|nr:SpoIID/LytB domain-containing protein [Halothece sp. PCC 7418]AFZ44839.1 SpoIID/LytB domain protein [Halothece sp. PCC 7418]
MVAISSVRQFLRAPIKPLLPSLLLWLLLFAPAQAATALRVVLKEDVKQVAVGSSSNAVIRDRAGNVLGEVKGMSGFRAESGNDKVRLGQWQSRQLEIDPKGEGYVWIGDRWYRGETKLIHDGSDLTVINEVNVEDYLYSVVGGEMVATWPLEALKAQAVAARSYALHKQQHSGSRLYDVKSTTASQVYKGIKSETPRTVEAVNTTQGQVLTHGGRPILAVFHSSSGGHTENVEDIWTRPLPYLRGVVDYDQTAPVYEWEKIVSNSEMARRLGNLGTIRSLIPQQTTPQGRIVKLKVVGDRATETISGNEFRKALNLRSTLFQVNSTPQGFLISGRGFGHGVGLSQWGAYYLAQQGANYRQILGHYYKQVKLALINTRVARN